MERSETDGYDRVRAHGSKRVNAKMDRRREANLRHAADEPRFAGERLAKLEREWDIDRAVLIAFAGAGTAALVLGLRKNWRWRFPLMGQIGGLLLHSTLGWSPQAAILRRLGLRTRQEIESERNALLSLKSSGSATA